MTPSEEKSTRQKDLFKAVFEELKKEYPRRNLELIDGMVYKDGKPVFNTTGYNLLYNLQRLTLELQCELI